MSLAPLLRGVLPQTHRRTSGEAGSPLAREISTRRLVARLLGRWWPLQVLMAFGLIELVFFVEQATFMTTGFTGLPVSDTDLPVAAGIQIVIGVAALLIALVLGFAGVALDPTLARRRPPEDDPTAASPSPV